MKIYPIAKNHVEVMLGNGAIVLFSYRTPVAAFIPGRGCIKTTTKYSVTTSRHVNEWVRGTVTDVDQSEIDKLVKSI